MVIQAVKLRKEHSEEKDGDSSEIQETT